MHSTRFPITPQDLWTLTGTAAAPQIIGTRKRAVHDALVGLLRHGFMVYDALFGWLRHATSERHNWPARALPEKAA
jgi:hypothetical protein